MINAEKSIIQFDENVFFNRNGIFKLGLGHHDAEAIYNHLYSQNMTSDGARAYIFIDRVIEFKSNYFKYRKFGILPKLNSGFKTFRFIFRESLRDLRSTIFGGYLYDELRVCGFFRFGAVIPYRKNSFVQLNGLTPYYLNKANQEPVIISDHRTGLIHSKDTVLIQPDWNIRLLKNPSTSSETDKLHNELYFELADVMEAVDYQCGDIELNNENFRPQMRFFDGRRDYETNSVDELTKESNRNFPSQDVLATQVSGLVSLIKHHMPKDFSKPEVIAKELERLHPDVQGLKYGSLSKTLAKGNKSLKGAINK